MMEQLVPARTIKINQDAFYLKPHSPKKRKPISYRLPEERIKPPPRLNLNDFIDQHN
jgi:hypothetical protein